MPFGAILVVFAISPEAPDPSWESLETAAREVLGEDAEIRVVQVATNPPDDESLERAGRADAVVELDWSSDHRRAQLHCYIASEALWADRTITFAQNDRPEERGRLLGFALASMIKKADGEPATEPRAEPPSPRPRAMESQRELETPGAEPRRTPPESMLTRSRSLEVAGTATTGIDGEANALGASGGVRLPLAGPFALRVGVGGRAGSIESAGANSRVLLSSVGLAWSALPPSQRLELGLRVDALASFFEVTRVSSVDGEVESQSRWTVGGDLLLEGGYRVLDFAGLYAAAGLEVVAGKTIVVARGEPVAEVPVLRALAEIGFRSRF